ncbi:MAG: P-loop NTPase fold protein, partial [Spirochaetota bacterium]
MSQETLDKIKQLKDHSSQHIAIWYNPWEHQFEDEPIVGLLHEIRETFDLLSKVSKQFQKIAAVSLRTGLDILANIINSFKIANLDVGKIKAYGDEYEKDQFAIKSSSQRFRLLFEQAIRKLLGDQNKTLIVFIDDLDRCNDQNIIKLIEGIKLYLSTSNCIFVFGMDQNNVLKALEKNNIHRDYLDKLFQCIIRIPLSTHYEKFIHKIVADYFPYLSQVKLDSLSAMLSAILEKNPRRVKNFLNSLRAYWESLICKELDGYQFEPISKGAKKEKYTIIHNVWEIDELVKRTIAKDKIQQEVEKFFKGAENRKKGLIVNDGEGFVVSGYFQEQIFQAKLLKGNNFLKVLKKYELEKIKNNKNAIHLFQLELGCFF